MDSQLSPEKKLIVVACLDRFLAICKVMEKKIGFSRNRSKQATTLIFFFQRKLRVHTLRIWKRGPKGGPGESLF